MSNLDEILRSIFKKKKVKKVKFQTGELIKIVDLLGIKRTKVLKPKHQLRPLAGINTQRLIAIDLAGLPPHKRRAFKASIKVKYRLPKMTKEEKERYRKYGRGVFVGTMKKFVEEYDRDYLYGYARNVLENKHLYKEKQIDDAQNYLRGHLRYGAPKLTKQYFLAKYGQEKLRKLSQDPIYQDLKKLKKYAKNEKEAARLDRLMHNRKLQLSTRIADLMMLEYRAELAEKRGRPTAGFTERFEGMLNPSQVVYGRYISRELNLAIQKTGFGDEQKFFKDFYSKYEGVDPGIAIGRAREEYAYQKLIHGLMETGLDVPLHPTNLHALKGSARFYLTLYQRLTDVFGFEATQKFIKDNLLSEENLSRTGDPDPAVNPYSLFGYFRETPQGGYPGQEGEKKITQRAQEENTAFNVAYRDFVKKQKSFRDKFEVDLASGVTPDDITSHFQMVIKHRKANKEAMKNKINKKK